MIILKSKELFFLLIIPLSFSGLVSCGGGDSGSTVTPSGYTLNSVAEGGNSSSFNVKILEQSTSVNNTGFVLLHGRGGNPDSAVVRQLGNDLYNRGYTILSIQEPVPAGYSEGSTAPFQSYIDDVNGPNYVFPETYARIRTAINELANKGITKIILIGFSMGSRMVSAHYANGIIDELPIVGVIGIGMYGTSIDPLNVISTISFVKVPVLDIFGSNDTNAVNTAAERKTAYEGSGTGATYSQVTLACDAGLTTNECHKLVNLKGTSMSELEVTVANWISNLK